MLFDINNKTIKKYLTRAEFGIEREGLRVSSDGRLAQTPHPFGEHKNIDRDFCENQIELISDVFCEPTQLNEQLYHLQKIVNGQLKKHGEYLWVFSNPPKISDENEIPVAQYTGNQQNKSVYRQYLAQKYGKRKMLFSGIHLNFSFTETLIQAVFTQNHMDNYQEFKNNLYLNLAQRLIQYAWLVVWLTAASPVVDTTIGTENNFYSSVRCSEIGYWNHFTPILNYSSLQSYIATIQQYIDNGNLRSVSELYYPVRLKPKGANSMQCLSENGINHLELRVIDVNPLSPTGIFVEDIRFVHLLMLYLVSLPEQDYTDIEQIKAVNTIKAAAVFGNEEIRQKVKPVLVQIKHFVDNYFPQYSDILSYQLNKTKKGNSYAEIISKRFGDDYMNKGLALAKTYQESVGYV